jgi:hypothetical protein
LFSSEELNCDERDPVEIENVGTLEYICHLYDHESCYYFNTSSKKCFSICPQYTEADNDV